MNTAAKKLNETEQAVADLLAARGVKYAAHPAGRDLNRDGWTCDGWRVQLTDSKGVCEGFDYYTGTGLRELPKNQDYLVLDALRALGGAKTETHRRNLLAFIAANKTPVAPCAASVLHSLILDRSAREQCFADWCADYGHDADSIKALGVYNACCDNALRLARVLPRAVMAELSELLADY